MEDSNSSIANLWKILLTLILLIYAMVQGRPILAPIVFSGFIAVILMPLVSFLERKRMPSGLSIFLTLILVFIFAFGGIYLIGVQGKSLVTDIPDLVEKYQAFLDKSRIEVEHLIGSSAEEQFSLIKENTSGIISSSTDLLKEAVNATSSVLSFASLVPIYVVFILLSRKNIIRFLESIGKQRGKDYLKIAHEMKAMIHNYIGGLLIVVIIIAVLNTVGLLALGIKHAIFLGALSGALTVIPYIGILVGGTIPILVAILTKDSMWYPFGVFCLIALIQFLEGNFITPKIMGSKVNINPLAAIVSLLIGAAIWGVIGMVIAIPTIGIFRIIFLNIEELKPYALLLSSDPDD